MSIYADKTRRCWLVNSCGNCGRCVREILQLFKNRATRVLAGLDDHMLADIG